MKEASRSLIDGYKNLNFYNKKKFLCSYNEAYNPTIGKIKFLQSNKNLIFLLGCSAQFIENKQSNHNYNHHTFNNNHHTFILRAMG